MKDSELIAKYLASNNPTIIPMGRKTKVTKKSRTKKRDTSRQEILKQRRKRYKTSTSNIHDLRSGMVLIIKKEEINSSN